jgi:hypothetical protein
MHSQLNPKAISPEDFPLLVFSDNTSGIIEFIIKLRTKGDYNHAMWANRPGYFASQGNTYSEAPVDRYLKRGNRLKYVEVLGLTPTQKMLIKASINKKLAQPWYKKRYDWLGILGQALGVKWINTPWLEYCSEDAPQHLKFVAQYLQDDDPKKGVILGIPKHASPQDLNTYVKKYPEVFKTYGKWEADDEQNSFSRCAVSGWLCFC